MKENSELKKRCKELEDKLAEMVTRQKTENLEEKDRVIAELRQQCDEVEGKANQLEKVVARGGRLTSSDASFARCFAF